MGVVFIAFLVIGLAIPVLPLHVSKSLGLGAFAVGLVSGAQFTASLLSRFWAGNFADSHGGKKAVITGLLIAVTAGLIYFLSLRFLDDPKKSVIILLLGRAVLGGAESFIITGALSWGLVTGGAKNAGKVMAWLGTALYLAFAVGAPAGTAMYSSYGFISVAFVTCVIPLLTLLFVMPRHFTAIPAPSRPSFTTMIGAVSGPGFGLALSSLGFGAISTFIILYFTEHGWPSGWLALTVYATSFIAARMLFGHLADRIGGARVAFASTLIEATGLIIIWMAPLPGFAFAGAIITGFGYSLVYPGFGVEALRRIPSQNQGLAMGAYTAFLDVALGIANPVLGFIGHKAGLHSVFLVSALVVICSAFVAAGMLRKEKKAGMAII